jgi:rare lipoprotein A
MRSRASALLLLLAGCAGEGSAPVGPAGLRYGSYRATGLASWYGEELAGARTATGERFDPAGITVAHRSLPLNSLVEVIALDTGRRVVARVADRGPGRDDRLVDLSRGTARLLGTDRLPVARVRLRAVSSAAGFVQPTAPAHAFASVAAERYLIQVAAFADRDRADALAERLGARVERGGGVYRVRLGPLDAAAAQRARDEVGARGYADAVLIPAN